MDSRKDMDEDIDNSASFAHMSIMNSLRSTSTANYFFSEKHPIDKMQLRKLIHGAEDEIKTNMEEEVFDIKIELGIFRPQGLFAVFK